LTYRTILLELRDEPASEARARAALALAGRFGAELVAIHAAALPAMPVGVVDGTGYTDPLMLEAQREASRIVQARVREAFERLCPPDVPARVLLVEDVYGTAVSDAARTADLTIVGPAHAEGLAPAPSQTVDSVLVEAGGPVLFLPAKSKVRLPPARALVAWDGGRQAARAVKDALPMLTLAEDVLVLTLGEDEGGSLEAVTAMLGRHGVKARAEVRPEEGGTGDRLLAVAGEVGADLLVMGAYSHSRLREAVFGGATRDVLERARLPVLLGA
jgi:nucleotide-binding universal stress UspA family protein